MPVISGMLHGIAEQLAALAFFFAVATTCASKGALSIYLSHRVCRSGVLKNSSPWRYARQWRPRVPPRDLGGMLGHARTVSDESEGVQMSM